MSKFKILLAVTVVLVVVALMLVGRVSAGDGGGSGHDIVRILL